MTNKNDWKSVARLYFTDKEILELDEDSLKEFLKNKEFYDNNYRSNKDFSKIQQNKNKKFMA